MKHPIQPISKDRNGVYRFKKNAIVEFLLNNGPHDMNSLAQQDFSNEDRRQFAQLIGYSVSGYGELHYVSDDEYMIADKLADKGMSEERARIEYLEDKLADIRESFLGPVSELYNVCEEDLADSR